MSFAMIINVIFSALAIATMVDCQVKPYMGWSSWSLQATKFPGLNPHGGASWLCEKNVLAQADAMAEKLRPFGYEYINIDSGWNANWGWSGEFDSNGRPAPDSVRFPRGIKFVADYVHNLGLKLGIYQPVGLQQGVFGGDQNNKKNFQVAGTSNCTGFDLVYSDWRTTNGWDSAYKMDFSRPCSQLYIDSIASLFASWGVDLFKLDGVGPGSFKSGPNYDNQADVAAWRTAFDKTGRDFIFEISWALDISANQTWTKYANGWRVDTDVDCYCDTLVQWDASVVQRFTDVVPWLDFMGPGRWVDLDSLNVGNGTMDGITEDERRSYMTLWAITCAPLFPGDDLTQLDEFGLELLTNRDVIAINQKGMPAKPVKTESDQQVWTSKGDDGSYVVALFNLGAKIECVTAKFTDFGLEGLVIGKDVWTGKDIGVLFESYTVCLASHASQLLKLKTIF